MLQLSREGRAAYAPPNVSCRSSSTSNRSSSHYCGNRLTMRHWSRKTAEKGNQDSSRRTGQTTVWMSRGEARRVHYSRMSSSRLRCKMCITLSVSAIRRLNLRTNSATPSRSTPRSTGGTCRPQYASIGRLDRSSEIEIDD